jgi:hypothetical protein
MRRPLKKTQYVDMRARSCELLIRFLITDPGVMETVSHIRISKC